MRRGALPFLSDEHQKAIACVSARSAHLDHNIEFLLAHLCLPNGQAGKFLIEELNEKKQVKLLRYLLRDQLPQFEWQIDLFVNDIHSARISRNQVIHYIWSIMDEKGAAKRSSPRIFKDEQPKSMTADEVWDVADALFDCVHNTSTLLTWYVDHVLVPRDKHARQFQPPSSPWPLAQRSQSTP